MGRPTSGFKTTRSNLILIESCSGEGNPSPLFAGKCYPFFVIANVKRHGAVLLCLAAFGVGIPVGVPRYIEYLVQFKNSSSLHFSVDKPRIALQMWKRKSFPRPLHIVIAPKRDIAQPEVYKSVTDYSFFDRGEYFEYTILIDEDKFRTFDLATQDEIAISIQDTVSTMLFPDKDQPYLRMEL